MSSHVLPVCGFEEVTFVFLSWVASTQLNHRHPINHFGAVAVKLSVSKGKPSAGKFWTCPRKIFPWTVHAQAKGSYRDRKFEF